MSKKFGNGADLQNQRIINLADGTSPTDAATKQQLDAAVRGLTWKAGVRAASTGNVVKATPGASIDGVTLAVNDRILLKSQTAPQENGIYVWSGASSALVRAVDADSSVELVNATVTVAEGTTLADTTWTQTANSPISVDTTPLAFVAVGGSASPYTAGNGLSLSSNAFAVNPTAGGGIIADGTGTRVDTAVVVRKYAANIGDGATTAITVTHNLGTKDVEVTVFDIASGDEEIPDVNHTTINAVTVTYAAAPASNAKRVVVQG
jgi:hypothetical protein